MRLNRSRAAADEELLRCVNDGYALLREYEADYARLVGGGFDEQTEVAGVRTRADTWASRVAMALQDVFPTVREAHIFRRLGRTIVDDGYPFHRFRGEVHRVEQLVEGLDSLRLTELDRYTDPPASARLYVEDIDSFGRVRDINPSVVSPSLREGRIELTEDHVQISFEQILEVPLHRLDWGGEPNDLYTANVVVNGRRTATAFALKGKGCKARELRIRDCGKNGDQLVRLVESPAELFVVQYVGAVSDAVIKDIVGKVEQRLTLGKRTWFCIIDGQDTARLLKAYGRLPMNEGRPRISRKHRSR